jgi:hypothetical protein
MALGQLNEAEELFGKALVLFRQLGDQEGETKVLSCISTASGRANAVVKS